MGQGSTWRVYRPFLQKGLLRKVVSLGKERMCNLKKRVGKDLGGGRHLSAEAVKGDKPGG